MTDRDALLAAVNTLVLDPSAPAHYAKLHDAITAAKKVRELRLGGELCVLNPLIEVALDDVDKFASVLQLIDAKREERGVIPLDSGISIKTLADRDTYNAYMKDFMAQKRARERRAVEIENMIRGEPDRLRRRSRMDFMQTQSRKWKVELDKLLETARSARGGRVDRETDTLIRDQFWSKLDKELDELEKLAHAERLKPPSQRRRAAK